MRYTNGQLSQLYLLYMSCYEFFKHIDRLYKYINLKKTLGVIDCIFLPRYYKTK